MVSQFPLEKILTCSARDYLESVGKTLRDYQLIGINCVYDNYSSSGGVFSTLINNIPESTEVVTDILFTNGRIHPIMQGSIYISGTALVPKPR